MKIQPAAGDVRSSITAVLPETKNPAGRRRRRDAKSEENDRGRTNLSAQQAQTLTPTHTSIHTYLCMNVYIHTQACLCVFVSFTLSVSRAQDLDETESLLQTLHLIKLDILKLCGRCCDAADIRNFTTNIHVILHKSGFTSRFGTR